MSDVQGSAPESSARQNSSSRFKSRGIVIALCFVAIVFDGYDLVVYGAITPSLLAYQEWNLSPVITGGIGSLALMGMFIGAITIGYLTDVLGRRKVLIVSVTFFSLMMVASAAAPNPFGFGLTRFLAGLGLGGVIPTTIALTIEFSPPRRRNFNNALMFSGYAVGGVLASVLSIALIELIGFRGVLAIGVAPLVLVVPLLYFVMPESPAFLRSRGRTEEAAAVSAEYGLSTAETSASISRDSRSSLPKSSEEVSRFQILFNLRNGVALALFCLAGIAGQALVYGLTTWLPQLMVAAGYSTVSSLTFLLASNVGAVVGVLASSRLADRIGPRLVTLMAFGVAALALLLMASGWFPQTVMYFFVAGMGFGSVGTQILVNGFVGTFYPDSVRATALGISLGVGRIGAVIAIYGGGVLIGAQLGTFANFAVWSLAAVVGIVAIAAVPRTRSYAVNDRT